LRDQRTESGLIRLLIDAGRLLAERAKPGACDVKEIAATVGDLIPTHGGRRSAFRTLMPEIGLSGIAVG